MNTVLIVKTLWISTVFATSALVSQALTDSRNQAPIVFQGEDRSPSDAGTEIPRGYAIVTAGSVSWSSWDAAL